MADETLQPLQQSFDRYEYEAELKAIFIKLYEDNLKEMADEINTYGMPHNGPFSLIERLVTADGLVILRQGDESGMRYLWNAWKHLNPDRGLHFLRTYLKVLFGDTFEVKQLWQKKSEPYPTYLRSEDQITFDGDTEDDYFLTSRVLADIDTDLVPDRVVSSLKTALAARFHLKVRLAKFSSTSLAFGGAAYNIQVFKMKGGVKDVPNYFSNELNIGSAITSFQFAKFNCDVINYELTRPFISNSGTLLKYGILKSDAILRS